MNYRVMLYFICLLFVFSCKKEHDAESGQPVKYDVKFNIGGFTQTQVPLGATRLQTEGLKTYSTDSIPVNMAAVIIFNQNYVPVYIKSVQKGSNGFGTFETSLPPGDYFAAFLGGDTDMIPTSASYPAEWKDTFYKGFPITITSSDVSQTVQLERITAQIELNIEDALPADVNKIRITYADRKGFSILGPIPISQYTKTITYSRSLTTADAGKTNYKIYLYSMNIDGVPFSVTVDYFTAAGGSNPVGTKVISGVTCQSNTRTILTGTLFAASNSSFSVSLDRNLGSTEIINF